MSSHPPLGRLERLPARQGWSGEAREFTPWLAENLDVLGSELGLALTLRAKEHPVGRFVLDLLLEDARGRTIVVENQFGQTDHDHLGKVLTYAAGTKGQIVMWIAESFTDEHAAALSWLNDNSVPGVGFFGVELELLRIGAERAPHFRVIVRPNEWAQATRTAASAREEWSWDRYATDLRVPHQRLEIGRALVDALETAKTIRELPFQLMFRKGYVALQREGGYNVATVDVYWAGTTRFQVKLPADPQTLGVQDPYPGLQSTWRSAESEWSWLVPTMSGLPDVGLALDLARPFHPSAGPMIVPRNAT